MSETELMEQGELVKGFLLDLLDASASMVRSPPPPPRRARSSSTSPAPTSVC